MTSEAWNQEERSSQNVEDPLVGHQLGQYRIEARIAQGGMATVYRATHVGLNKVMALKVLLPTFAQDGEFVERFRREAQGAAHLDHPNIVRVHDTGEIGGYHYIAMEYLGGGNLEQVMLKLAQSGHVMTPVLALDYVRQIAEGLDYAHRQGIIHRDIKPSNIMLRDDGRPVLTDLGIARAMTASRLTRTAVMMGTPQYMSPEQGKGDEVDHRSDIYSLGVVLYELLTGRRPFQAETPWALLHQHVYEPPPPLEQVNPRLPKAVCEAVSKALVKDPAARYQTAGEMALALSQTRASLGKMARVTTPLPLPTPTPARPPVSRPQPILGAARRRRSVVPIVAGSVAAVLLIVSIVAWALLGGGTPTVTPTAGLVAVVSPTMATGVEVATKVATQAPTPTPSPTATPKPTPTPTATPLSPPVLIAPEDGSGWYLYPWREMVLSWDWTALQPGQRFRVVIEDGAGQPLLQSPENGVVEEMEFHFTLTELGVTLGTYRWTVLVEEEVKGKWQEVTRAAEWRTLRFVPAATATPAATPVPTEEATAPPGPEPPEPPPPEPTRD